MKKDKTLANKINKSAVSIPFKKQKGKNLTGRVIFGRTSDMGDLNECIVPEYSQYYPDGELNFYCGPEERGGYLHDEYDCYEELRKIFSDIPEDRMEIGSAENYHSIAVPVDCDVKAVWDSIRERLIRCGAIEFKELV